MWTWLDGKLPPRESSEDNWLQPPLELDRNDWDPWALGAGPCRLTVIRGEAGAGKSRTLRALADRPLVMQLLQQAQIKYN